MQDDTVPDDRISPGSPNERVHPKRYAFEIEGVVTDLWDERLEGWQLKRLPGGNTRIVGDVRDQSELYGVLAALRNMGLALLRVEQITESTQEEGVNV